MTCEFRVNIFITATYKKLISVFFFYLIYLLMFWTKRLSCKSLGYHFTYYTKIHVNSISLFLILFGLSFSLFTIFITLANTCTSTLDITLFAYAMFYWFFTFRLIFMKFRVTLLHHHIYIHMRHVLHMFMTYLFLW